MAQGASRRRELARGIDEALVHFDKPATDAAAIAQLRDLITPEVITITLVAASIFLFVVGTLLEGCEH